MEKLIKLLVIAIACLIMTSCFIEVGFSAVGNLWNEATWYNNVIKRFKVLVWQPVGNEWIRLDDQAVQNPDGTMNRHFLKLGMAKDKQTIGITVSQVVKDWIQRVYTYTTECDYYVLGYEDIIDEYIDQYYHYEWDGDNFSDLIIIVTRHVDVTNSAKMLVIVDCIMGSGQWNKQVKYWDEGTATWKNVFRYSSHDYNGNDDFIKYGALVIYDTLLPDQAWQQVQPPTNPPAWEG